MCHDIQYGSQIAQMLGMQGLTVVELDDLGGHLTEPPLVESWFSTGRWKVRLLIVCWFQTL
ncbi:MAG TPA: hypothetical protein VF326_02545 [Anaerolineaceae bacterium]|jgi:hypothetical protein